MIKYLILFAILLLTGLLFFEKKEKPKGILPVKTLLSLLFVVLAVSRIHLVQPYILFLVIGMLFCLAGDIFLALPQDKMFLLGLISFLGGHICYVIGFFWIALPGKMTAIGVIVTAIISGFVYLWLKPHLKSLKRPVTAYIVVISLMMVGAWTVLGEPRQAFMGRLFIFIGAASFYLSDIFVARDRFLTRSFLNRLLGLPLYYLGQFLIAFSIGMIR